MMVFGIVHVAQEKAEVQGERQDDEKTEYDFLEVHVEYLLIGFSVRPRR
jgi:hypothetical protein